MRMTLPVTDITTQIQRAAQLLRAGELVAFPTETVYGLGADASNPVAVAKIFATKGRPADHPLIVHVAGVQTASHYASSIPDFASALMAAFWPGPLTVILPRRPGRADAREDNPVGRHDFFRRSGDLCLYAEIFKSKPDARQISGLIINNGNHDLK